MLRQKRVAAIHDISGFGKCSLTVALPVISAAGIETAVIPTAVLSTHTACKPGYTYRDLTEDILPFAENWKDNGICFDAVYSGFLGSIEQVELVGKIFDILADDNTLKIVDPAMADNGKMYSVFDMNFASEMVKLCSAADVIVPNITEAVFMLGRDYFKGPYTSEYIKSLIFDLAELCNTSIVLTGVSYDNENIGAAAFDIKNNSISTVFTPKINGMYHGTGDVFASVLTAGLVKGQNIADASRISAEYTYESIKRTYKKYKYMTYGVDFESGLYKIKRLTEPK